MFDEYFTSVFLYLLATSAVDVKNNEDKSGKNGSECSEEVRIGNEEESFELIMFVRTNRDSLGLLNEVVSCLLVVDLILIDSFL
jgi:hypothetical protein